ncbi:Mrp/NBP35 family ATP-binding protein [Fuerstiella marisgermanici]|uniref:Iron-sulfur cluster carrier protein n=1 Tax=Fuerstiella marisgermanici TaxID=1891926 RepID=A0A1P8WRJ9_9PLAN|nr:Mrp/NBP35 family ATP-binding protein [Fuerstiella marisgermanici]APZ96682.1 antiporter inner membrane protein [Fuerstiella marisgermanici]
MASVDEIRNLAGQAIDPEIGKSLSDLRMIGDVSAEGPNVEVVVELPTPAYPNPDRLKTLIEDQVAAALADGQTVTTKLTSRVRGKDAGGRIGLKIHNIIAVGSGKGGVGKSTVAAALACGLHSFGCKVGLMDADVYGPSIPHMLGAGGQPGATEQQGGEGQKVMRMEPIDVDGMKLMSMGFFIEQGQSVVWRGPMLHKALTQFLKDTQWGELDYLIIDLPPGTGDVSLTLSQQVGLAGAVIVCTPQQVALLDAIKAVDMYQKVNVPVLGFVENMTGDIFGRGGAKKVAEELKLPFLGEVPIDACIREYGDAGKMMALLQEENSARDSLRAVCQNVAMQVARNLIETPAAPTLEIL